MRSAFGAILIALLLAGCTGPTELSNDDVERQRKEFSQENYEKSLKDQGKTAQVDQERKLETERASERAR